MTELEIVHSEILDGYIRVNVYISSRATQTVIFPASEMRVFLNSKSDKLVKPMRPFSRNAKRLLNFMKKDS